LGSLVFCSGGLWPPAFVARASRPCQVMAILAMPHEIPALTGRRYNRLTHYPPPDFFD
jgi:hypothetical protein